MVKLENELTQALQYVRQGDSLSPLIFDLIMDKIMKKVIKDMAWEIKKFK